MHVEKEIVFIAGVRRARPVSFRLVLVGHARLLSGRSPVLRRGHRQENRLSGATLGPFWTYESSAAGFKSNKIFDVVVGGVEESAGLKVRFTARPKAYSLPFLFSEIFLTR